MRDAVRVILLIPVLVFPLVVIASGGDLELLWRELRALADSGLVVTAQAGLEPSPTATMSPSPTFTAGPSPTLTIGPSPTVTLGIDVTPGIAPVPALTRWGTIFASIILALIG